MYNITVSEEIKRACPVFKGAAVYAEVTNTTFCKELWDEINAFTHELTATTQADDIKLQPAIAATREVYKRCGKRSEPLPSLGRSIAPPPHAGIGTLPD